MDNSTQWPQGFGGVLKGVDNPSSESIDQQKKTLAKPQKDQIVNCPRCNSVNTKFCYFNNYSLSQPRFFCKTCRRYWTAGGSLRNVPVGGGSRKNRRSSSSTSSIATASSVLTAAVQAQAQATSSALHHGHDLNLSFPPHPTAHDDHHRHQQYPNPNPTFTTTTTTKPNFSNDDLSNTKLLSHQLRPNPNSNMTPLLPPMGLFKSSPLAHDSSREMMISLMNPPQHHNPSNSNSASIFATAEFPPMNQDQFKHSSLNFSLDGLNGDDGYAVSSLQLGRVQQQGSDCNAGGARLLFPFNQQDQNMNKEHLKQVPNSSAAVSSDNVQFDHQQNNINRSPTSALQGGTGGVDGSSTGFWTGMLSGGSW